MLTLMNEHLPDVLTAEQWLADHGVRDGLLAHCRLVAAIAEHLALRLRASGEAVDPILAHRGGLLHDVAKLTSKDSGVSHEILGAQILRDLGQPTLAEIVARHAMWAPLTEGQRPETWEQKLVYYADRVAMPPRVAAIAERLADVRRRKPELSEVLAAYEAAAHAQEREIAERLGLTTDDLRRELEREVGQAAS
jgi:putative nucleotidyltransferase with HDIG domain